MGFLDRAGLAYLWEKVRSALGLKMDQSLYDPQGRAEDVFGYVDAKVADYLPLSGGLMGEDARIGTRGKFYIGMPPTSQDTAELEVSYMGAALKSVWGKAVMARVFCGEHKVEIMGQSITLDSEKVLFNSRLQGVASPVEDTDAANKGYVDTAVSALPVRKLTGTAEHPIDLDTLTEPGRYYIEGELVEKAGDIWFTVKSYIQVYSAPIEVFSLNGQAPLQSVSSPDGLAIFVRTKGETAWSEFQGSGFALSSASISATLLASAWTGTAAPFTQTVSLEGVVADTNGSIGLAQDATAAQRAAARAAMLSVTGQNTGTVTVTADGEKPTVDIPVAITILG